jgi:hypothetical protein
MDDAGGFAGRHCDGHHTVPELARRDSLDREGLAYPACIPHPWVNGLRPPSWLQRWTDWTCAAGEPILVWGRGRDAWCPRPKEIVWGTDATCLAPGRPPSQAVFE